ncbi:arginase family protein [Dyella silvatica]|uniref:arginase family protein n=1 Tax=Dyella silvatica TaxID=2992128 RepID=UPI00225B0CC0|nr:arginase family protein [Dyella silvatica]
MSRHNPLILDFDGSIGALPGATTMALSDWQEAIRFGCTLHTFNRLRRHLDARAPADYGTVLMGSGDYHHLTWPLVERQRARGPFQLVVFDNHPDNMRFPWGIHCGSWVRKVAMLPYVTHVHVVGITSGDIGAKHAWENYLRPLRAGKLSYWCMDVDVSWAKRWGIAAAFHRFDDPDALTAAFIAQLQGAPQPTYLSIDKDAFSVATARTNWDQGLIEERHAMAIIEALHGRIIASDINGEVSAYAYTTWWKRLLSGMDGQEPVPQSELDAWQAQQRALNTRLLKAIATSSV